MQEKSNLVVQYTTRTDNIIEKYGGKMIKNEGSCISMYMSIHLSQVSLIKSMNKSTKARQACHTIDIRRAGEAFESFESSGYV